MTTRDYSWVIAIVATNEHARQLSKVAAEMGLVVGLWRTYFDNYAVAFYCRNIGADTCEGEQIVNKASVPIDDFYCGADRIREMGGFDYPMLGAWNWGCELPPSLYSGE